MRFPLLFTVIFFSAFSCCYAQSEIPHDGIHIARRLMLKPLPDTEKQLVKLLDEEQSAKKEPVEVIEITSASITRLPGSRISKFPAITTISLKMPALQQIPAQFGKMKKLEVLYLQCPGKLVFPSSLKKRHGLRITFICSDSTESESLSAMKHYKYLEGLEIRSVPFKVFPEWICTIGSLEYLHLQKCHLTNIPASLARLHALGGLYLDHNSLSALPTELSKLDSLIYIGLSDNNFDQFPTVLLQMKGLHSINLSGNSLHSIPDEIVQLKALFSLDLSRNPINAEEQEKIRKLLPDVKLYF